MTDRIRHQAARMVRSLMDSGKHRKEAFYETIKWVKTQDPRLRCSRSTLYAWCDKFGVSTR